MSLSPMQQWRLTCAAYRRALTKALSDGDHEAAERYQRILREKEQVRPEAAPRRAKVIGGGT